MFCWHVYYLFKPYGPVSPLDFSAKFGADFKARLIFVVNFLVIGKP